MRLADRKSCRPPRVHTTICLSTTIAEKAGIIFVSDHISSFLVVSVSWVRKKMMLRSCRYCLLGYGTMSLLQVGPNLPHQNGGIHQPD